MMKHPNGFMRASLTDIARISALIVLVSLVWIPGISAQETVPGVPQQGTAVESGGARKIAIFTYEDPGETLAPSHRFALFTVPDVLRVAIIEDGRFELVERSQLEAAQEAVSGNSGGQSGRQPSITLDVGEEKKRVQALEAGADHFVWGRVVFEQGKLTVFHHLVEARSGRTIHISYNTISVDDGIFDAVAASAREFGTWMNKSLPSPPPEVVVVETERVVERQVIVERTVEREGIPAVLTVQGGARIFWGPLAPNLAPVPEVGIDVEFGAAREVRWHVRIDTSVLQQIGTPFFGDDTEIKVFNPTIGFGLSFPIYLDEYFRFEPGFGAGLSLLFGKVNDSLISYPRPALDAEAALVWMPDRGIFVRVGVSARAIFAAWNWDTALDFTPVVSVGFAL